MNAGWIPVALVPPPEGDRVLVCCETAKGVKTINIGYFDANGTFHGMGSSAKVKWWMPLPMMPGVCVADEMEDDGK